MKVLIPAMLAGLSIAGSAQGATMGFDSLPDYFAAPLNMAYSEDGITATTDFGVLVSFGSVGMAHLDDSGTDVADRITFAMSGRFDAQSFDIAPLTSDYTLGGVPAAYDNVLVQGWRDGVLVAQDLFAMGTGPWIYRFGADFSGLDQLVIGAVTPGAGDPGLCFAAPCAHFDIDNISLTPVAPVPLPAGLPLLLAGLAPLALRRRRT